MGNSWQIGRLVNIAHDTWVIDINQVNAITRNDLAGTLIAAQLRQFVAIARRHSQLKAEYQSPYARESPRAC